MAKTQEKVESVEKVEVNTEVVALKEVMAQLQAFREEIDKLKNEKNILEKKNQELQNNELKRNSTRSQDSEVTLYFNQCGTLDIGIPGLSLRMTEFGEERIVNFSQFQQLVGQYRRFFDNEALLVGPKDIDLVDKYKVKAYDPESKKYVHYSDIQKMANMSGRELQDYYDQLSHKSQMALLSLWVLKCYDKEPGFYTIEKMDALNRASGSKTFDLLIDELRRNQGK